MFCKHYLLNFNILLSVFMIMNLSWDSWVSLLTIHKQVCAREELLSFLYEIQSALLVQKGTLFGLILSQANWCTKKSGQRGLACLYKVSAWRDIGESFSQTVRWSPHTGKWRAYLGSFYMSFFKIQCSVFSLRIVCYLYWESCTCLVFIHFALYDPY